MAAQRSTRHAAISLAFVWCVMVGASAVAADPATAVLEHVSGAPAIFELSAGKPRQASYVTQGSRYELPLEIETGATDSATFALSNSVIEVSPNTLMRIVAPESQDNGVVQRVLQQAGSSLFRVHRGTLDRFQVETPFLVSVVKGTVFNVLVRDDGATVSLQEGHLQVNSLDARQTVDLLPGDVAFAGRDGALRMLKIEVTDAGGKTRETVATRTDAGVPGAEIPVETHGVVRDVVPAVGTIAGGAASGAGSAVASVGATVSPVVDSVVAPVAGVVEPVATQVVAPVVATVVAPVVNAVVGDVVAPVVNTVVAPAVNTVVSNVVAPTVNTVVAPVVNTVVAPVIDSTVAPVVNAVVAPVVNTVVAPVVTSVVAPVVTPVVTTVVAPVVAPVVNTVVAPVMAPVAPVVAPVVAVVTPVIAPVVAPVVTPIVAPVVAPIVAPIVAPLAPVVAPLAPITNLLGLH